MRPVILGLGCARSGLVWNPLNPTHSTVRHVVDVHTRRTHHDSRLCLYISLFLDFHFRPIYPHHAAPHDPAPLITPTLPCRPLRTTQCGPWGGTPYPAVPQRLAAFRPPRSDRRLASIAGANHADGMHRRRAADGNRSHSLRHIERPGWAGGPSSHPRRQSRAVARWHHRHSHGPRLSHARVSCLEVVAESIREPPKKRKGWSGLGQSVPCRSCRP